MVRISTIYDKTINKRVFLVRGDERYAHSTSTIVSVGNKKSSTAIGYVVPITVNVRRDVGSSKVVVYDNDDVINVIDWSESQVDGLPFDSPSLAWDSEHIIKVEYMGNSQCSPSSATYTIPAEANPDKYDTELTITTLNRLTYPNISQNVVVSVTCEQSNINGETISFYVDNELVDTATVDEGTATISLSLTDVGLHTLKAQFLGSVNHYASSVEQTISCGLIAELTGLPSATVIGGKNYVEGVAYPYGDITGSITSATYIIYGYVGNTRYNLGSGSLDSYGTFRDKQITFNRAYDSIELNVIRSNTTFKSEKYPVQAYNIQSIELEGKSIVADGFYNYIDGSLVANSGTVVNVPVNITVDGSPYGEFRTDESGGFEVPIQANGSGNRSVTASVSTDYASQYVTASFSFEDVLQYWSRIDGEYNQNYTTGNTRVLKLNNGYKLECIDNNNQGIILFPSIGVDENYTVEYDQIMGSGDRTRVQIGMIVYTGQTEWTGKHIKYVRENGIGSLYIGGVLEQQESDTLAEFRFGINLYGGGQKGYKQSYLLIDNFKLKRGA